MSVISFRAEVINCLAVTIVVLRVGGMEVFRASPTGESVTGEVAFGKIEAFKCGLTGNGEAVSWEVVVALVTGAGVLGELAKDELVFNLEKEGEAEAANATVVDGSSMGAVFVGERVVNGKVEKTTFGDTVTGMAIGGPEVFRAAIGGLEETIRESDAGVAAIFVGATALVVDWVESLCITSVRVEFVETFVGGTDTDINGNVGPWLRLMIGTKDERVVGTDEEGGFLGEGVNPRMTKGLAALAFKWGKVGGSKVESDFEVESSLGVRGVVGEIVWTVMGVRVGASGAARGAAIEGSVEVVGEIEGFGEVSTDSVVVGAEVVGVDWLDALATAGVEVVRDAVIGDGMAGENVIGGEANGRNVFEGGAVFGMVADVIKDPGLRLVIAPEDVLAEESKGAVNP